MNKKILTLVLGIYLLSFVAASSLYSVQHSYYDGDDLIRKSYHYFEKDYMENENRYPVYDYRDGYTYRTSKNYLDDIDWYEYEEKKERDYYKVYNKAKRYNDDWEYSKRHSRSIDLRRGYEDNSEYEYVSWLGEYQEKKCHNSAPEGQLFYIKC